MNQLEKIKKFIELRSSGESLRNIASLLGLSTRTLVKWNRKYCNVVFEVQSEEMKAFKNKILREKMSRLEFLNEKFASLKAKLDKSEIIMRYDRVMNLLIKVSKSIDDCEKNVVLSEISGKIDELDKNEISNEIELEEKLENQNENA
jgi:hypothetical protein